MLHSLLHIHSVCHNTTIKKWSNGHVVCLPSTSFSCTYTLTVTFTSNATCFWHICILHFMHCHTFGQKNLCYDFEWPMYRAIIKSIHNCYFQLGHLCIMTSSLTGLLPCYLFHSLYVFNEITYSHTMDSTTATRVFLWYMHKVQFLQKVSRNFKKKFPEATVWNRSTNK